MADRTVMKMRRHGMFRTPANAVIDKHITTGYNKAYNMLNIIIASKFKNRTCHFNCLATINYTMNDSRVFLGVALIKREDFLSDTVSNSLTNARERRPDWNTDWTGSFFLQE